VMASTVLGDVYVRGYYREDGIYVKPHYRSDPDGDFYNNWSTYPNVNPYTGKIGTRTIPPNLYPGGYFDHDASLGSDSARGYSYSDDEGTLSWTRILLVIGAIAYFSSVFIKKDEEQKPS
jgi:hypothetical protein